MRTGPHQGPTVKKEFFFFGVDGNVLELHCAGEYAAPETLEFAKFLSGLPSAFQSSVILWVDLVDLKGLC